MRSTPAVVIRIKQVKFCISQYTFRILRTASQMKYYAFCFILSAFCSQYLSHFAYYIPGTVLSFLLYAFGFMLLIHNYYGYCVLKFSKNVWNCSLYRQP